MLNLPIIDGELDELAGRALEIVDIYQRASASLIQRRLDIGYARSARILDQLTSIGAVSPADGAKPRKVLFTSLDDFLENNKTIPSDQKIEPTKPIRYKTLSRKNFKPSKKPLWTPQLVEYLNSKSFSNKILIGYNQKNQPVTIAIEELKNLLVIGNPHSHKETFIDNLLIQSLINNDPDHLRIVLYDHGSFLSTYHQLPHLLCPIISDHFKLISALMWTNSEMNRRVNLFKEVGVRNFNSYNQQNYKNFQPLPKIFIIAILNSTDDSDEYLQHLISNGSSHGIHVFLVLNRATNKEVSSTIKSGIPHRLVFTTTTARDSRTSGVKGAENLSTGQCIFKFTKYSQDTKLTIPYSSEQNAKLLIKEIKKI